MHGIDLRTLGLLYIDGDGWREQRRFSLSTLRDLGFGRPVLEQSIMEEIQFMIPVLRSYATEGKRLSPQGLLEDAVANVICRLIFGRRYDYQEKHFSELVDLVVTLAARLNLGSLIGFQSWFRYLPIVRGIWKQGVANQQKMYRLFEKFMAEHEGAGPASAEISDYIDAFRRRQEDGKGKKGSSREDCGDDPNAFRPLLQRRPTQVRHPRPFRCRFRYYFQHHALGHSSVCYPPRSSEEMSRRAG